MYQDIIGLGHRSSSKQGRGMRLLLLASGDLWAGAEVMIFELASVLSGLAEVELHVALLSRTQLAGELEKHGVTVHVVDESRHSFLTIARKIRQLVNDLSPDIIHSHRYKENLLAWLAVWRGGHCKLVATQHGLPEHFEKGQAFKSRFKTGLFFRLLAHKFDRTALVSNDMRKALVGRYGFAGGRVIVIHNGISIPSDIGRHVGQRVIVGSAGRLFPVKDYGLFVDVARLVVAQNNTVDFVLAGDGPERGMLEGQVRKCGLGERFRFLGHQEDMAAFYKGLDVYVNTSVHEGIPMSVLEAMSHCVPVVVPNVGGFPEIVEDGVGGFLVDSRDPKAFAQRILQLLDPGRRRVMGNDARERVVASFSREAMARKYYQLYRELINGA